MLTALDSEYVDLIWRCISAAPLLWLAIRFGRTLQSGQVPMIEQIARVSTPHLAWGLVRYTRRLTTAWSIYLIVSMLAVLIPWSTQVLLGAAVGLCSILFFVVEHWLRPYFFPLEKFPSLVRQLRDTIQVFRQRAPIKPSARIEDH